MKRTISIWLIIGGFAFLTSACKDRAAEKRIAELEGRLAQLETNKGGTGAAATAAATAAAPAPVVADEKPEGPLPIAEFSKIDHDFGTVSEGKKYPIRTK